MSACRSLMFQPSVPVVTTINGGFSNDRMVYICGTPRYGAQRFTINLQERDDPNPGDIGLHFDVRINAGGVRDVVVRNNCEGGSWGIEERDTPYFPFRSNEKFYLIIHATWDKYIVSVYSTLVIILCIYSTNVCHGHGWLKDPPSRSSMWKYGFPTPPNYNHMQLFCGGFYVQTVLNHGKCGTCGDRWDGTRENEAGGPYATGRISRRYQEGQTMTAEIMITAQHFGYFEFRVCPNNNTSKKASEECFEKYPLHQPDGSERYYLNGQSEMYNVKLVLPMGLTCSQCVFQWTWYAALTREEYRNCADIAIEPYNRKTLLPLH